jgi:hypothetical protein
VQISLSNKAFWKWICWGWDWRGGGGRLGKPANSSELYDCFKALGASIQSEVEFQVAFRDSIVGESWMFSGPNYGRLDKGMSMALLTLVALAGCSGMGGVGGQGDATAAPPGRILDPIAAFAADPPPSGQGQVFLPERNEPVTLRFLRQYSAASGRECREVRVAQRSGETARLFCRAGPGWIEARPLLAETVGR